MGAGIIVVYGLGKAIADKHKRPIVKRRFLMEPRYNIEQEKQTITPKWIMGVRDLPNKISPETYMMDGRKVILSKRNRQVVDALIDAPLYCASTVRISDTVFRLKSEHGLRITTARTLLGRHFYILESEIASLPDTVRGCANG